jgi:uncharacterized membrane protein HdeD (DUF308 family)
MLRSHANQRSEAMIERNLGNLERVIRLALGMIIVGLAISAPTLSLTELFVSFIGLTLILNGAFSRCYVWYFLKLNTTKQRKATQA